MRNQRPALGLSAVISLSSSLRTRSMDTMARRPPISVTALVSAGSGETCSWATKRAARIIRSGSSLKDSSGERGVRRVRVIRSAAPPNGSTSTGASPVSSRAMALMVKSRRERSVSMSPANCTSGLRESGEYASARWVVISYTRSPILRPIVPNLSPWAHTASARSATSFFVSCGVAVVVASKSIWSRGLASSPSSRSRTVPPTRYRRCPACRKRLASGSISWRTGAKRAGIMALGGARQG